MVEVEEKAPPSKTEGRAPKFVLGFIVQATRPGLLIWETRDRREVSHLPIGAGPATHPFFALCFPDKRLRTSSKSSPYHLRRPLLGHEVPLNHWQLPSRWSIRDGCPIQTGQTDSAP